MIRRGSRQQMTTIHTGQWTRYCQCIFHLWYVQLIRGFLGPDPTVRPGVSASIHEIGINQTQQSVQTSRGPLVRTFEVMTSRPGLADSLTTKNLSQQSILKQDSLLPKALECRDLGNGSYKRKRTCGQRYPCGAQENNKTNPSSCK